jgi:hypothetical protein
LLEKRVSYALNLPELDTSAVYDLALRGAAGREEAEGIPVNFLRGGA